MPTKYNGCTMEPVRAKELIAAAIAKLPDDATIEEAIDAINLLYEIEIGTRAIEEGQTVSAEEARRRMARWLK